MTLQLTVKLTANLPIFHLSNTVNPQPFTGSNQLMIRLKQIVNATSAAIVSYNSTLTRL
jgi:hypothetical protein